MGIEESYIRKTEGLIRSIKHGTKKPSDANVEYYLERVKKQTLVCMKTYQNVTKKLFQIIEKKNIKRKVTKCLHKFKIKPQFIWSCGFFMLSL